MNSPYTMFAFLLLAATALAADEPAKINYADHVRPILREHCFSCHSQAKATNDLALDSYEKLMAGGGSGKAIEAGDAEGSFLYGVVSHKEQPYMPPKQDKLADAKLEIIKKWINEGALKDAGANAVKPKPAVDLSSSAGAARPEGPPIMPEGIDKTPITTPARPGAVTALAAAPWAPLWAVAGQKQIALYHSETNELLAILPFPEGVPHVLRFSRSGALLLAGGGRGAKLGKTVVFDVKTGKRLSEVGDEIDAVLAADISPDHKRIALGGPQRIVRVFNVADGTQQYELRKHTDWILAVEFSPDGRFLATADRSGGVRVWEADAGVEYLNLEAHKAAATAVAWRDDSKVLVTAGEDGAVKLWDMVEGKMLRTIAAHPAGVAFVAVAHDGRIVSCGRDKLVKLLDPGGKPPKNLGPMNDIVLRCGVSHDGKRILGGDFLGEVRVFNADDGKPLGTLAANPKP